MSQEDYLDRLRLKRMDAALLRGQSQDPAEEMNNQVKIFLWCVPRSCSTAFSKAISKQENSKTVMEPFSEAYYYGEERISARYERDSPKENSTFNDLKESLENDYNDYSVIFAKDMAYYLRNHMDCLNDVLPEGYKHTFLIRHPRKTVASLFKASLNVEATGWNYFDKDEAEFKSLHDLFFKIKDLTQETPIVVEAADLLANPEVVLNMYCQKTGLPYSESMLTWDQGGMNELEAAFPGWQSTLSQSTGFHRPSSPTSKDSLNLSKEAKLAIEENIDYYNVLYKYKLSWS